MSNNKKKKERWLKARHAVVRNIVYALLYPYARLKFGITVKKFRESKKRQYLILYNHQTSFDQFFIGMTFKGAVYYLASEDLFSNGALSSLIRWLVAPIPIKKQTTDIKAIKTCIQVAREGGTIAIAPEGNRTYSGKTEYMSPAIAALAKKLGLPIALLKIEGGYGVQPRWSDVVRKGKMRCGVSRVVEPWEYEDLSGEELAALIENELYVNEAVADGEFIHKKSAEYVERVLYVCPYCGLSEFESHNDTFECKRCGRKVRYGKTKELQGVGFDLPFRFLSEWYDYQKEFVSGLDSRALSDTVIYNDTARLSEVIIGKNKNVLRKEADIRLYGNKIVIDEESENAIHLSFDDVYAVSVLGRNKLNIYYEKNVYQLKGSKRFNAIKYVNLYYNCKNVQGRVKDGKFLGL